MLLYNHRKEFIGIDEDDLSSLDFQNISQLQDESHDFADLFVKKPGYIHNFKNFSWIDFILHSETDESKAVIHAKGINYSCALHVAAFNFTNDESGYVVTIRNLRALKGAEGAQASKDLEAAGGIQSSPALLSTPHQALNTNTIEESRPALDISLDDIEEDFSAPQELPNFEDSIHQELREPEPLDIPESLDPDLLPPLDEDLLSLENDFNLPTENEFGAPSSIDFNAPLDIEEDLSPDNFSPDPIEEELTSGFGMEEKVFQAKDEAPMLGDYVSPSEPEEPAPVQEANEYLSELVSSGTYKYDPNIAADELGLPVDLIEEFIGDFIDQAHEFKDDLYASINGADFDNVQVLSHKLKGVAANLRVEDAFDVLSVVNTSKEIDEITPNIDQFYKIISKLEGKEEVEETPAVVPVEEDIIPEPELLEPDLTPEKTTALETNEEYDFGIKQSDDAPILIDEEVNIQELNDDLYDDLLIPTDSNDLEPTPELEQETPAIIENEDIYDDLLGTPEEGITDIIPPVETALEQDDIYEDLTASAPIETTPELDAPIEPLTLDDDLYDDLIGAPKEEINDESIIEDDIDDEPVIEEEIIDEPVIEAEVPVLNFDPQSSANELGIPLEIVKEFIQDFKEQVNTHQIDFENAMNTQDIKEINQTATLLKGMSDNLRLNEISEVLKELQSETDINNTVNAIAKVQAYADQL